jgi:hypothetical protein
MEGGPLCRLDVIRGSTEERENRKERERKKEKKERRKENRKKIKE